MLMQAERLGGGQIPPELVFLAHHQGETAAIGVFAFPRHVAQHAGRAGGGRNHAGEQFQGGRFAGPVRSQKGDELALLDRQIDPPHGLDRAIFPVKQPGDRGRQAFLLLINAVGLRQALNFDRCHDAVIIDPIRSGGKAEMTNDEARMTNEARNPNDEDPFDIRTLRLPFVIQASSFVIHRHSPFIPLAVWGIIRHEYTHWIDFDTRRALPRTECALESDTTPTACSPAARSGWVELIYLTIGR